MIIYISIFSIYIYINIWYVIFLRILPNQPSTIDQLAKGKGAPGSGRKKTNRPVVHRGQNIIHRDLKSETRSENQGAGDFCSKTSKWGRLTW